MNRILMKTQKESLHLLKKIVSICEEQGFQYTLWGQTLWSAEETGGFFEWAYTAQIALFYEEYKQLLEYCLQYYNDFNGEYFVMSHYNCEEFQEIGFRFAKRSEVSLPESVKQNEKYYSYHIGIVPIFYAGQTYREFVSFGKKYHEYNDILNAVPCLPYAKVKNGLFVRRKRQRDYEKRKELDYKDVVRDLSRYSSPTKYVFIPSIEKQKGVSCKLETYRNIEKKRFEDEEFCVIKNIDQWKKDYYGRKRIQKILETLPNYGVLEGPERVRQIQLIGLELLIEFDRICRKHSINYSIAWGTLLGAIRHGGFIPWDDDVDVVMEYEQYLKFEKVAQEELDANRFFLQNQNTDVDTHLVFPTLRRQNTIYSKPGSEDYNTNRGIALDLLLFYQGSSNRFIHLLQDKVCKFYKRMTWAHMEHAKLNTLSDKILYSIIRRKGKNKYSYHQYLKCATWNKKDSEYLTYLNAFRNPFGVVMNRKDTYNDLIEVEFEGYKFYAPHKYDEVLKYCYSEGYMHYPVWGKRVATHLPGQIAIDLKEEML